MEWTNLPTDYADAIWSGKQKYVQTNNDDGTVSFEDVTEYAQKEKSFFGAKEANAMNGAMNLLASHISEVEQNATEASSSAETAESAKDVASNMASAAAQHATTATLKATAAEKSADSAKSYAESAKSYAAQIKTPVRGTDYWTADDIATIKEYVDDAILGGEW